MPSPGSLRYLKPRLIGERPHTVEECDRELERLSDLVRLGRPKLRTMALNKADEWLDERNRATTQEATP